MFGMSVKELEELIQDIERISCGEDQVAETDTEALGVIYDMIQKCYHGVSSTIYRKKTR